MPDYCISTSHSPKQLPSNRNRTQLGDNEGHTNERLHMKGDVSMRTTENCYKILKTHSMTISPKWPRTICTKYNSF